MYCTALFVFLLTFRFSSADGCGVADFLEQLVQSVHNIQRNGSQCGPRSEPRIGKAGPIGAPGPRGPAGVVDMEAIEQLFQRMIFENLLEHFGFEQACSMGMKSRHIQDHAITASSFWDAQYGPYRGRLDNQLVAGRSGGAWVARISTVGIWLQVDFGSVKKVAGVITQGRPSYKNQHVRSFKISCGHDQNLAFIQENGQHKVFNGNTDPDSKVYNRFKEVLSCRFIRIYPQSWNEWMSMRVEFVAGTCFDLTSPFQANLNNA